MLNVFLTPFRDFDVMPLLLVQYLEFFSFEGKKLSVGSEFFPKTESLVL